MNKVQKIARIDVWSRIFVKNTIIWSKVLKEMLEVPEDFSPEETVRIVYYPEFNNGVCEKLSGIFIDITHQVMHPVE